MAEKKQNLFATLWFEKRIIAITLFVALARFQYGFDSAASGGFQGMPGFLEVFGYADVRIFLFIETPSLPCLALNIIMLKD